MGGLKLKSFSFECWVSWQLGDSRMTLSHPLEWNSPGQWGRLPFLPFWWESRKPNAAQRKEAALASTGEKAQPSLEHKTSCSQPPDWQHSNPSVALRFWSVNQPLHMRLPSRNALSQFPYVAQHHIWWAPGSWLLVFGSRVNPVFNTSEATAGLFVLFLYWQPALPSDL